MASLEFFYDYTSPYSYLAAAEVPKLAEETGAAVRYVPVVLGGIMLGSENKPPGTVRAKGVYMNADLARWARHYGLPFAMNPHFPVKTILPLRGALVALEEGVFPAYQQAVFHATWGEPCNVGDAEVLRTVLGKAGLDAEALLARTGEDGFKQQLRANTDEAVARGAFGAPTFFVGDEMFFGNDRLHFVRETLRS